MDRFGDCQPVPIEEEIMKDPYIQYPPDQTHLGFWLLKITTPVLLLIIGFFVRVEMEHFDESITKLGTSMDRLNDSVGTINNRTTHLEDAIEYLKERK